MPKPEFTRPPLVKSDVVHWDHKGPNGDCRQWEDEFGKGPFIVSKILGEMDGYDHCNPLIFVKRLSDGYHLPSVGNHGWWMGYFIKDEFLSAVKHAKKGDHAKHDNPLPSGRKRARQRNENG